MERHTLVAAVLWVALAVMAGATPALVEIPEQVTREGQGFPSIRLESWISDAEGALADLEWSLTGTENLSFAVYGQRAFVSVLDPDWSGSEVARVEVCDPDGACASQDVVFTVQPVNDPPVLTLPDVVAEVGEALTPIPIQDIVRDIDHDFSDLSWHIAQGNDVAASIVDGAIAFQPLQEDWLGVDLLQVTVCDPDGDCASGRIQIVRRSENMLSILRVSVAGYVIRRGDLTVAIDALLTYGVQPETLPLLSSATPPYDPDLILVTHSHFDHFSEHVVAANMRANPEATLLGPPDVIDAVHRVAPELATDRLVSVALDAGERSSVSLLGLEIEVVDYPHSPERAPRNIGYLVHFGGDTILHTGDLVLDVLEQQTEHALTNRSVSIALIPSYALTSPRWRPFVHSIDAKTVIPIHLPADLLVSTCAALGVTFDDIRCFHHPEQELFFDDE